MASLDDASRCPRCQNQGQETSKKKERKFTNVVFTCKNPRCRWFETTWVVSVNSDGSITERTEKPSDFPPLPKSRTFADEYLERLQAELNKPTGPGKR